MSSVPWFATLERMRHRIPFWWWLTYDALVGVVIWFGVSPSDPAFWLGFLVLGIAVVIDTAEFIVKRPAARAALAAQPPRPIHELLDDDDLAVMAEDNDWAANSQPEPKP